MDSSKTLAKIRPVITLGLCTGLMGLLSACHSTGDHKHDHTAPPTDPATAQNHHAAALTMVANTGWQKLNTVPYRGKQDDITFIDANNGWYGNGQGKIYKTTDGGAQWQEVWAQPGTFVRAIGFVDQNNGWMGNIGTEYFPGVTDTHPLYRTKDGGRTWNKVTAMLGPAVKGICAIDILPTKFINSGVLQDRLVIHAAGRVGGPAMLMRSLDGGETFKTQDLSAVAGMILDVKFFDASEGLLFAATDADASRSRGLILHTNDGGNTWRQVYQSSRNYELVWKASFPTRQVGYATLQSYNPDKTVTDRFVLKTTDGGRNWQEIKLVNDFDVREFGVGFATPDIGWVGATTSGFQTTNGGQTWQRVEMGRAVNKIRIMSQPNAQSEGKAAGAHAKTSVTAYAIGVDVYKLQATLQAPVKRE